MNEIIRRLCKNVIKEYERFHNLDKVIYLLVEDEKSAIRSRRQDFVTSTLLESMDSSSNARIETGKMFAELLTKNVLTITDITRGIDAILKGWNDYLIDYPYFFYYIATIIDELKYIETVIPPLLLTSPKSDKKYTTTARAVEDVVNVAMTDGREQTQQTLNSKTSKADKKKTDCAMKEEIDSIKMNERFNTLCRNVIKENEQFHNLEDIIYLLVEDENSVICMRFQDFVTSALLMSLDDSPNIRTETGKMLVELLSMNVLTITDITQGIDAVLKEWNEYLIDYPYFSSYVSAIVAPLLTSETSSFSFHDLKCACSSICQNNSSVFFTEVLQTILNSKNAVYVQNDAARECVSVLQTYNMWKGQTEHVPLDVFIPDNQINTYFKNDNLGVLLLAMSMHKITEMVEGNKSLYSAIHKWIKENIDEKTVRVANFVWSLTVATVVVCSNNDDPNVEFFDRDRSILIKNYIRSECDFTKAEIQEKEFQCIRGVREISAALQEEQNSKDIKFWTSRLLRELCLIDAISTKYINHSVCNVTD